MAAPMWASDCSSGSSSARWRRRSSARAALWGAEVGGGQGAGALAQRVLRREVTGRVSTLAPLSRASRCRFCMTRGPARACRAAKGLATAAAPLMHPRPARTQALLKEVECFERIVPHLYADDWLTLARAPRGSA